MKLKKRSRIYLFLTGMLLLFFWMFWGNRTIQVSQVEITDAEVPDAFIDFKIAHLSDIHDKNWGETLIAPIQEENPDIIVITGDLIDSNEPDIYSASLLIEELNKIAPIYFVTGNHEAWSGHYDTLKESLLNQSVNILDNEAIVLQRNGEELLLLGLKDSAFATEDEHSLAIEARVQELSGQFDGFKLLLAHRPELFESYVRNDLNLVLSGHAHGGQFRLPFIGGLIAPDQGLFPEYTSGVYEENKTKMVVSRGLGNSIIPLRFNNRPELIFIELTNEF